MLKNLSTAHRDISKEKKQKKRESNPLGWRWKGWQGFLKKYYLTKEGGDFFKNP
jgi:hypothetical protein